MNFTRRSSDILHLTSVNEGLALLFVAGSSD
jgi:hypothetical protein